VGDVKAAQALARPLPGVARNEGDLLAGEVVAAVAGVDPTRGQLPCGASHEALFNRKSAFPEIDAQGAQT
jgi:hypothetical protein